MNRIWANLIDEPVSDCAPHDIRSTTVWCKIFEGFLIDELIELDSNIVERDIRSHTIILKGISRLLIFTQN